MVRFNEDPVLSDSKYKKAAIAYSAFFHEPENIPVDEDPFSRSYIFRIVEIVVNSARLLLKMVFNFSEKIWNFTLRNG